MGPESGCFQAVKGYKTVKPFKKRIKNISEISNFSQSVSNVLTLSLPFVLKNPRGGVNFPLNGTGSPVPFKEKSHLHVGFFLSHDRI